MPAESEEEVVLEDGERGDGSREENGTEEKEAFHDPYRWYVRFDPSTSSAWNNNNSLATREAVCFRACSGLEIFLETSASAAAATPVPKVAGTFLARARDVYRDGATHELLTMEHGDCLLGFIGACHFYEAEALGAAGGAILDQRYRCDGASLTEVILEVIFGGGVGQVAYIKLVFHLFSK